MDLSTDYLGMKLKNPLAPSASPLAKDLATAKRLEDAGASAIVMYSLFEEDVRHEDEVLDEFFHMQDIGHAEADSYRPMVNAPGNGVDDYLAHIDALKHALDIPVIASLNGITPEGWHEHALEIEQAGADALELNVYYVPANLDETGEQVEQRHVDILTTIRSQVSIPITMKLSPRFSAIGNMVKRLEAAGANGVSLFNRFYQPGIDLETLTVTPELHLSTPAESLLRMRWIAILHGRVGLSLAATGGIHGPEDALRLLLAGADVTHLCATLLKNGPEHLGVILAEMEAWLEAHEYESIQQMKGSVSQQHAANPTAYERANYLEVLRGYDARS